MKKVQKLRSCTYFKKFVNFSVGARHSIDSTAMTDFRPSDIQLNLLTNSSGQTHGLTSAISNLNSPVGGAPCHPVPAPAPATPTEVVILPSNLSGGGTGSFGSIGGGSGGSGGLHHPHHRHHRPFPLQRSANTGSGSPLNSAGTLFSDIP